MPTPVTHHDSCTQHPFFYSMEAEKETGPGGAPAVDPSSARKYERKRFYVELKPGETTIVSWKKLMSESNNTADSSSSPAVESPSDYIQEDKPRREHPSLIVNKGKEHKTEHSKLSDYQPKNQRNRLAEVLEGEDEVHLATKRAKSGTVKAVAKNAQKVRKQSIQFQGLNATGSSSSVKTFYGDASGSLAQGKDFEKIGVTVHSRSHCNDVEVLNDTANQTFGVTDAACFEPQPRTLLIDINTEEHSFNICDEDNARNELPDLNLPYMVQTPKAAPIDVKDESGRKVEGPMLEKAIQELEEMAAESRELHNEVQNANHSLEIKRKLPWELKQKLAKVARIALSNEGKISDELFNHLMRILGYWVKPKTLKRYLREIVTEGLSASKEEDGRFRQIKKEVVQMISSQTFSVEAKAYQGGQSNCGQLPASGAGHKGSYIMNYTMEDQLCDLYDIYVQGMDELKIPEIRKFYNELAGLWPIGAMDNHGIRNAICRSKERRRMLFQEKGHEKCKRKKSSTPRTDENLHGKDSSVSYPQVAPERRFTGSSGFPVTSPDSVMSNTPGIDQNHAAPAKGTSLSSSGSCVDQLRHFEVLEDSSVEQIEFSVKQQAGRNANKKPSSKCEKDSRNSF